MILSRSQIARHLVAAAALILLPISANASDPNDSAIEASMTVDFYFGGIQIGTADLSSRLYDNRYEMVSTGRGTGLADLFTGGRHGTVEATGSIEDGTVKPYRYAYQYGTDTEVDRQTQVTFNDDAPVTLEATPAYGPDDQRAPVPLAEQLGTLDPLSAALFHLTLAAGEQPCGETVRIFDGRRRSDLHTKYIRPASMTKSRYNAYEGDAIMCEAVFERIKGFDESATEIAPTSGRDRISRRSKTYEPAKVWLAPIPVAHSPSGETVLLPVKLQVATGYGTIMVHLSDYELRRTMPTAQATLTSD